VQHLFFVWGAVGHAAKCIGNFGVMAGMFRVSSTYFCLTGCSSLCDVMSLEDLEHPSF
jgi:hypothetical protein